MMGSGFKTVKLCAMALIAGLAFALSPALGEAAFCLGVPKQNAPKQNAPKQEAASQFLSKGLEAYKDKDFKSARKAFEQALKIEQDLPQAHLMLASIYWHEEKLEKALEHVKKTIKIQADYPEAHYLLAQLFAETGDVAEANKEVEIAIGQYPNYAPSYKLKGDLSLLYKPEESGDKRKEQYARALESYEKALQLFPDDGGVAELRKQVEAFRSFVAFSAEKKDATYKTPIPVNRPFPSYTDRARNAHISGIVRLAVSINENGEVIDVLMLSGPGYGLNEEAVKAAKKLKFTPGTKDGVAIPCWQNIEVEFNLRQDVKVL